MTDNSSDNDGDCLNGLIMSWCTGGDMVDGGPAGVGGSSPNKYPPRVADEPTA